MVSSAGPPNCSSPARCSSAFARAARGWFERVPASVADAPAEMLLLNHNHLLENGHRIRQGIEFDRIGRRVAYHFLRRHPGDITDPGWPGKRCGCRPSRCCTSSIRWTRAAPRRVAFLAGAGEPFCSTSTMHGSTARRSLRCSSASCAGPSATSTTVMKPMTGASRCCHLEPGQLQIPGRRRGHHLLDPADVGGNYESFQYRTCCRWPLPWSALRQPVGGYVEGQLLQHPRGALGVSPAHRSLPALGAGVSAVPGGGALDGHGGALGAAGPAGLRATPRRLPGLQLAAATLGLGRSLKDIRAEINAIEAG